MEWLYCEDKTHFCYTNKKVYDNQIEVFHKQIPSDIADLSYYVNVSTAVFAFMAVAMSVRTFKYFDVHPKLHILARTVFGTGAKLVQYIPHTPYPIPHTPYTIHHTPYTIPHTPYTIPHTLY
jgi:hypothetical protein